MTLIISVACQRFAIHSSDRRTTIQGTSKPYDQEANKAVVFRAADGIVTLGYAGLAYVKGQPTDSWIAGQLVAASTDKGRPTIHAAMQFLSEALSATVFPPTPIFIFIVGWLLQKVHPDRPKPILGGIGPIPATRRFGVTWLPLKPRGNATGFSFIPPGWLTRAEKEAIADRVFTEEGRVLEILAESIADVSRVHPEVGPDVMTVFIRRPVPGRKIVDVLFFPADPLNSADDPNGITYTPWFVVGRTTMAPLRIVGNQSADFRFADFAMRANRLGRTAIINDRALRSIDRLPRRRAP